MDIPKIKKIYMIGIKGVGMTMLAQYFHGLGIEVSGSDTEEKFMTDGYLHKTGIKFAEHFSADNIPKDADLIVYSQAYNAERNIEVKTAEDRGLKMLTLAEATAKVFNHKYGIAVCGSHGKTTTTAWLGYVLDRAGLKPSVMVGSIVPQFDGPGLTSTSQYLVIEADEYKSKFLQYEPKAILLNNIEWDHPDSFPTEKEYVDVYRQFIRKVSPKGFMVANYDDRFIRQIAQVECRGKLITYAIDESADYVAYDIQAHDGQQYFSVKMKSEDEADEMADIALGDFVIAMLGRHNIYNALAVIATAIELGVDLRSVRQHLGDFTGTARRMQTMGTFRGATIIDDYAHHPTEIRATLDGIRQKYPQSRLRVVFHPHTFTRTKALLDDFAQSFGLADEVVVVDIYGSAREVQGGVHSLDLVEKIKKVKSQKEKVKNNEEVVYKKDLIEVEQYLRDTIERGDIVVLMGAGDVFRVGENLVK